MEIVEQLRAAKASSDSREKIELLDHVSDVFQSYAADQTALEPVFAFLVEWLEQERDREIATSVLDAIRNATFHPAFAGLNLDRLASILSSACDDERICGLLEVFAYSTDRRYVVLVETFQNYDACHVRAAAHEALRQMRAARSEGGP